MCIRDSIISINLIILKIEFNITHYDSWIGDRLEKAYVKKLICLMYVCPDSQIGANVRHGIKIYSCTRDKWLLFCCRTAQDKGRWLDAFAQERQMVAQDLRDGLELSLIHI